MRSSITLRAGDAKSCGCLRVETIRARCLRHGQARKHAASPTYRSWQYMHSRVKSRSPKLARVYRDRGIKVCDRWKSFEAFLADMGERPDGLVLDRIDGNRGYEPTNCRWITPKANTQNRRRKEIPA